MAAKIPFVFGVTGHRHLAAADLGALEDRIAALLREQKRRYPSTPLLLLTCLAEGGDRVAAKAAFREGVEVVPVLPMAQEDYEQDFRAGGALQEFRDLLARASAAIVLGPAPGQPTPPPGPDRDALHVQAGLYVALHSNLLIALWDGHDTNAAGKSTLTSGTAAIVHFRHEGSLPNGNPLPPFCRGDASVLDAPELGPLLHIPVPREGDTRAPNVTPFARNAATPGKAEAIPRRRGSIEEIKAHLDVFNSDVDRLGASRADKIAQSAEYLLPEADAAKHPELAALRARFATADILAIAFRDRVQQMLLLVSGLALAAVASFELFAHVREESNALLGAYAAILAVPWGVYLLIVRPRDWQGKYLDYRALAEALRVQFFWRLAGVPLNAADFYLRRQTGALTWIRQAARACNVGVPADAHKADIALVRERWIADQQRFFERTTGREERTFERWNLRLIIAYCTGIVIAVALLAARLGHVSIEREILHFIIVAMGFAPALAASIGFVLERRAYESHIRQYELMAHLYDVAGQALAKASNASDQRAIVEAIGREALAENGDWYFTHRARSVAPPRGG